MERRHIGPTEWGRKEYPQSQTAENYSEDARAIPAIPKTYAYGSNEDQSIRATHMVMLQQEQYREGDCNRHSRDAVSDNSRQGEACLWLEAPSLHRALRAQMINMLETGRSYPLVRIDRFCSFWSPFDLEGDDFHLCFAATPTVRAYVSTAVQTQNGLIYFTSPNTVEWIDPHNILKNTVTPSTVITSATVDGKVYENPNSLDIPKGTQNIQIDYTATSLLIPQRVQFRYKLEGFDRDWEQAGSRRQAFYSRLPPGNYTFRVLASNNDGVWSTSEGDMRFNVPPAFFQTWWFRGLCLIAVVLLSVAVYLLRIRRLTAQIRSKFYERLAERERIARDLHDTFFQSIQGLLLRFNTGTAQLSPEEPARQIFMDALKQSDLVMSEGRELVLDLRATEANTTDLPNALSRAGEDFRLLNDSEYKVIVSGRIRPLHPVFSTELYRLAREAIYNAFRHANARTIEAEFFYGDDFLKLSIRDDGIGIDEQVLQNGSRAGHLGITTMKERSQKIGGKLRIWSQRGNGTEIDVSVPASVAYLLPEQKTLVIRLFGWIRKIS